MNASNKPNHKIVIGVTTSSHCQLISWWFIKFAIFITNKASAKKITSEQNSLDFKEFDSFIISGGEDVQPALYNEQPIHHNKNYYPERDSLEMKVIKYASSNKIPLMGICRGMQIINVVLGGSLHQEASDFFKNFTPNTSLLKKIFDRKTVKVLPKTKLASFLGMSGSYKVNSIHHQAVKKLGKNMICSSIDEHKMVQAIENKSGSILGVQWHPELMLYRKSCRDFFQNFVNFCLKHKNKSL
ncbi:MAG: gamma-glutamyl-gamma-aminobutyrate hydrolase family protein [Rickettsiales bacterium]